jgi:site-specific recombinase XerD
MPETRQMNKFNSRVQDKLKELQNLEYISEDNYQNIQEFTEYVRADTNVSNQRIYKYLCTFKVLFKDYIDFDLKEADKKQWRKAAGKINNSDKSPHTTRDYIVTAKKYYNTVFETQTERPDRIKKILNSSFMSTNSPSGRKREYEALTPEQVMQMSQEAKNPRDRLLPVFLFETGCRVGELLGLKDAEGVKLDDVQLKQKYAEVEIETLKKKEASGDYPTRSLPLTRCMDLLQKWLEEHPAQEDDKHLFVNLNAGQGSSIGDSMAYRNVNRTLDKLAEAAGIDTRVSPHIFRHSSATHKGVEWNAEKLMWWHGWEQLETAQNYVQQNEERLKASHLEDEGIKDSEENGDGKYSMKTCGRCGEEWPPTQKYCGNCSLALDFEAASEAQDLPKARDKLVDEALDTGKDEILERLEKLEKRL